MSDSWRLLGFDSDHPAFHLASLEALWRSLDDGAAPDTIVLRRLSPCVLIGTSQTAAVEVDLDECRRRGIPVLRRPSEGGAIYCDRECLVFSCLCRRSEGSFGGQDHLLPFWGTILAKALQRLGVGSDACFVRPNDVSIDGKKVAGLTVTDWYGIRSFSGSLLMDCDLETVSAVLTPSGEKLNRHGVESPAQRIMGLRQVLGPELDQRMVAEALLATLAKASGRSAAPGCLSHRELETANELIREKYGNPRWNEGTEKIRQDSLRRHSEEGPTDVMAREGLHRAGGKS